MAIVQPDPTSICWSGVTGRSRTGAPRCRCSCARAPSTCSSPAPSRRSVRVHPGDQGRDPASLQGHGPVPHHGPGRGGEAVRLQWRRGIGQITTLLTHVCLGELRHAVSHMTMVECIEQRKTTLSGVMDASLRSTIHAQGDGGDPWGIEVEVAQVAQVFIVDAALRQQLEAEVRNEIKVRSDQSDILSQQAIRLAELAAEGEVQERRLASDQQAFRHAQERFRSEMAVEQDHVDTETPVRLQRIAREREVLEQELVLRRLQAEVQALDVERDLLLPRAQQDLRLEILPLEQAPRIVEAAAKVLHGANLSIYGGGGQLLEGLAPIFDLLARSIGQVTRTTFGPPTSRRRRAPRRRSREDRGRSDDLHLDVLEGRFEQDPEHRLAVGEVVEGATPVEGAQDTPGQPGVRTRIHRGPTPEEDAVWREHGRHVGHRERLRVLGPGGGG